MRNYSKNIARDESGAIMLIFALVAIPLMVLIGGAVDFGRAQYVKSKIQTSLDNALLAAAMSTPENGQTHESIAKDHFAKHVANKPSVSSAVLENFSFESGVIKATASVEVSTAMLRLAHIDELDINVFSQVNAEAKNAEVALVLDYSGSMSSNDKYVRMKNAVNNLIDILTNNESADNIKVGVVPFQAMVHADLSPAHIRSDVTWEGCTQDRSYPENTTNATPTGDDNTKWGMIRANGINDCNAMKSNNLKVSPLSDDYSAVKSDIDLMSPGGNTHIALGTSFGWHLLSPSEPFTGAKPFSDFRTMKIMIVLTDGKQTALGNGPGASETVAQAEANLQTVCQAVKDKNIRLYTIGYDLGGDTVTKGKLESCAGAGGKFFDEMNVTGIDETFEEIANEIKRSLLHVAG